MKHPAVKMDIDGKYSVIPLDDDVSIFYLYMYDIYRIMAILKVKTDIITSISASSIGRAVILVITYVETFKMDVIVFIGIKHHNVT